MSQVVSQSPPSPAPAGARGAQLRERIVAAPFASSLVACILLALLSAAVLPTVPSYDPWSWIVWGREVFDPHLSLVIGGGSSWKPFPVIFTAVYGLFSGGPTMWVITERAGALMAFVAAYRLAAQLTARIGYARLAPVAGLIAAFCLILLQDFAYYFYRGASEPILVGCALWGVDRLLAGKRWQAYMLGVTLGLMRPEVWPLMVVFAAWLAWKEPTVRVRVGVLAGLAFMPFMWFAPPGITTGNWFSAATQASEYNGHLGADVLVSVLRRGADDQSVPVLALAVIALLITLYKERDRAILAVGALGIAWWVIVIGETLDGYPGLERFFLPGAAMACVLAGVGVVRIGALAGELAGALAARVGGGRAVARPPGGRAVARPAAVLAALIAVVLSYHYVAGRVTYTREQYSLTKQAVRRLDNLGAVVAALGGHNGILPCKSPQQSYIAVNHSLQTALAFKVHSTLERVGTAMVNEGLDLVGPWDSIDGEPAALNPYLNRIVFLKQVGVFKVYRVYHAGDLNSCVGT